MNVLAGNTEATFIGEVTAQLPIGNTIASQFRWKDPASAPSYCSINHQVENYRLKLSCIPPRTTPAETHELIIETFDNNSSVKSALRTDKITLNVEAYVYFSISNDLGDITYDWSGSLVETDATFVKGSTNLQKYEIKETSPSELLSQIV